MAKLITNADPVALPLLSWGTCKANKDLLDALSAPGLTTLERTEKAADLLRLSVPDLSDDTLASCSPGAVLAGAFDLFHETFNGPTA
jgi:hypothetical protein